MTGRLAFVIGLSVEDSAVPLRPPVRKAFPIPLAMRRLDRRAKDGTEILDMWLKTFRQAAPSLEAFRNCGSRPIGGI
jgi:hypothetical protein